MWEKKIKTEKRREKGTRIELKTVKNYEKM